MIKYDIIFVDCKVFEGSDPNYVMCFRNCLRIRRHHRRQCIRKSLLWITNCQQTAQDLASACEGTDWELDHWIGFQDYSGFKLLRSRLDGGDFKLRFVFRNKRTQAVIGFKLKVGHSEEFPGFGQKCLFHLKQIIEGARQ